MQGNPKIMAALDELLAAELCAINTYFVNAKLVGNWGFRAIEKKFYDESMTEMRHAETSVDRIIYLDGIPNLNKLGRVKPGKDVDRAVHRRPRPRGRRSAGGSRRRSSCAAPRATKAPESCSSR